jgi:tRNA threonylcarbamoyladenosine biosynthesis protein TsaE
MPILDPNSLEFFSRSAEQTRRLGMRLGALLQVGDLLCLSGDLGSGKTTLVQGIAQGWGSLDPATSPTFVLVNIYRQPKGRDLYHLDAYRLANAQEGEDLDLVTMLDEGALAVEWPERIDSALPRERLSIKMGYVSDEARSLTFVPQGKRYEKLLAAFRRQAFGG